MPLGGSRCNNNVTPMCSSSDGSVCKQTRSSRSSAAVVASAAATASQVGALPMRTDDVTNLGTVVFFPQCADQ